ncbi:MAG: thioredoxin, partial [Prochloron sp. SP5CPC1]|nr:thioredoxin [Candidatus Paraprochloron terpiosi SP5CPC1]
MIVSINEQTFVQEVLASDKPVIVHFWAPWCGLCRAIEPILATFQSRWEDE